MALVPVSQAAEVVLPAAFTINSDTGTNPYYRDGLLEGFLDAADDENSPNPGNSSPELSLRMGNNTAFGPDAWANPRTWIYTGQIFTGPNGIISFAFNNDDTDWLKINGVVVLNDNGWDTTVAGVANDATAGLGAGGGVAWAPNTWVDFEYRVTDTGGGGAGPSGQNTNGASGWNNTTGAVMSWNNENGSLNANDYIGGSNDLGKPTENIAAAPGASLFRYNAGFQLADDLSLTTDSTITINGGNPLSAAPTLTFKNAAPATLTVNDGLSDPLDPLSPIVHKTFSIAQGTTFTANNQSVTISGTSDVRPGKISGGAFTGNTLTAANPGLPAEVTPGQLIIDHVDPANASNLSGVRLQAGENGRLVIRGVQGLNPISSMTQPLTISGVNGRINIGSDDQGTVFNNSFAANESGTLEHTTPTNSTLGSATNGVTIAAGKNLTVDVKAGTLTIAGSVTGPAGSTFTKAGDNALTVNGNTNVGAVVVNNLGQLTLGGGLTATTATVNDGTLTSSGQTTLGSLTLNGGTARFAGQTSISSPSTITNGLAILSNGAGNNITGALNVGGGGVLQVVPGALGNGTVNLNGGTLDLSGGNGVTAVTGFGTDGTGYQINFNNTANTTAPSVENDVLTVTRPVNSYAGSAFNTTKQDVSKFIASFTYQEFGDNNGNLTNVADGAAFVLQNAGTSALGGGGGGLGYSGVGNSAAFLLNIWSGGRGGPGQTVSSGGKTPGANAEIPPFNPTGAVDLRSGHPINITLTYNGSNVDVLMVDGTTGARFTTTYTGVDVPAAVGGNTAYVGFSGANGGLNADQRFSNFVYKTATATESFGGNINVAGGATSTINSGAVAVKSTLGALTIANNGNLQINGASNLTFTNSSFSASNGTYTLGVEKNEVNIGSVNVAAGAGTPTLNKDGNGTLVIESSGTTAFPSGTTFNVRGGKLSALVQSGNTVPIADSTIVMNGGGVDLSSKSGNLTFTLPFTLQGSGGISAGFASGAITTPVNVTVNSPVDVGAGKTFNLSAAKQHSLILNGAAPVTTGGTVNIDGGTVTANGDSLKGHNITLFPSSGSTTLNVPAGTSIGSLAGDGKSTLVLGSGAGTKTLTITQSTDTTFAGAIQNGPGGTGALVKSGSGTLALTGASNFSGGITVTQGVIDLSSTEAAGTGALTLSGGTIRVAPSGLNVLHYDTDAGAENAFRMTAEDFNTPEAMAAVFTRYNSFFTGLTPTNGTGTRSTLNGNTRLNFNGGEGAPFSILDIQDLDNMTVRMSGYLNIPEGGTIRFLTESDDGSVVFIDGLPVVNNNRYQGAGVDSIRGSDTPGNPALPQPATPTLAAGQHKIDIGFYEGGGGASVRVLYRPVGATSDIEITNDVLGGFYGTNAVNVTASSTLDLQGSTSRFGTLTLSGGTTFTVTAGNAAFSGGVLPTANGVYNIDKAAGNLSVGAINDGNAALTINKTGPGTLTLTNNTQTAQLQNTSNVINVNGGALGAAVSPTGTNPLGKATINLNGTALNLSSNSAGNVQLNNNVNIAAGPASTIDGGAVAAKMLLGTLTMPDTANLQITGASSITFNSTAFGKSNGTYTLGVEQGELNPGTISFAAGTGTSTFNKTGNGTLVIESFGTNALPTGTAFNIQGGKLSALVQAGNTVPISGSAIVMNGGGLDLSSKGGDLTFTQPFTLQGNGGISAGFASGAVTTPVNVALNSPVDVGSGKTFNLSAAKQHTLVLNGTASAVLGGTVNIDGGTVTANGDSLKGHNVTLFPSSGPTTLNVPAGTTIASLAGDSKGSIAIGGGAGTKTLTVDQSTNTTFAGAFLNGPGGSGALVKSGAGTLALTGSSSFSGGITVNQGVVDLAGNLSAGTGALNLAGGTIRVAPSGLNVLHYDSDAGAEAAFRMTAADFASPESMAAVYSRFNDFFVGKTATNGTGTRTDINGVRELNFNGGDGAPFGLLGINDADNMTVRMSGYINIPEGGTIRFLTDSDDGSVVFINGLPVVNNNRYQGAGPDSTRGSDTPGNPALDQPTTPTLAAGQHKIDIGFYEGGGGASVRILYRPVGSDTDIVITNDVLGGFHGANAVNVTASSTLELQGGTSNFGALTLNGGTTLTVTNGNVTFTGATLPNANGVYNINKADGRLVLGSVNDGNAVVTINKTGVGTLVLSNAGTPQFQNASSAINVNAGALAVVLDSAGSTPLGLAKVNLNGGNLFVSSKDGEVTLNNSYTVSQNAVIAAGNFGGGAVDGQAVKLPSLNIPADRTLTLRSQNGYTLGVNGAIAGAANSTLRVAGGDVTASSTTNANKIEVAEGSFNAKGNITAAAGVTIDANGTLAVGDATNVGTTSYTGGTVNINGGLLAAKGGVVDFSTANVTFTQRTVGTTSGALRSSLYSGFVNPTNGFGSSEGLAETLTRGATAVKALDANHFPVIDPIDPNRTDGNGVPNAPANHPGGSPTNPTPNDGKLYFGERFSGDTKFAQFFDVPTARVDAFTASFTGKFNATETGLHEFGYSINDDGAAFWLDLNQNGIFELNGSSGNERITFSGGCCGEGADSTLSTLGSANLIAGQSYNVALILQDTGGGSSVAGRFKTPSMGTSDYINPGQQSALWSEQTVSGGGRLQVDGGTELRMSSFSGATDVGLLGNGARLTLNSGATSTVSRTAVLRTGTLLPGEQATIDVGQNNTFEVANLTVSNDGILIKAGKGTVIAENQSVGIGALLQIDDGEVVLKGSVLASNGTDANRGSALVNGGMLKVNGVLPGSVTVNIGGRLSGNGTVGALTSNGVVSPGDGIGALKTENLTFSGGTLELQIGSISQYDQLVASGSVSLISDVILTLTLGGFNPSDDGTMNFKIIDNTQTGGGVSGTGRFVFGAQRLENNDVFVSGGQEFRINYTGGDGNDVVLTAVPEPTTAVTLLGAIGTLMGLQRFRRRKA